MYFMNKVWKHFLLGLAIEIRNQCLNGHLCFMQQRTYIRTVACWWCFHFLMLKRNLSVSMTKFLTFCGHIVLGQMSNWLRVMTYWSKQLLCQVLRFKCLSITKFKCLLQTYVSFFSQCPWWCFRVITHQKCLTISNLCVKSELLTSVP